MIFSDFLIAVFKADIVSCEATKFIVFFQNIDMVVGYSMHVKVIRTFACIPGYKPV